MKRHLVLADYDGTLANTSQKSPRGKNVESASMLAVHSVFGEVGVRAFHKLGGVKSREPGELVEKIRIVTGKTDVPQNEATEMFVASKLRYLLREVGSNWPRFYPGAIDFLKKATTDGYFADVGIISSGHDAFINRSLEKNGIDSSRLIIVTSDLIRQKPMPERPRYKPHSSQFAEAHKRWLDMHGGLPKSNDRYGKELYLGRGLGKPNILYIGDSVEKDGGLAKEARVPFIFVPNTEQGIDLQGNAQIRADAGFLEINEMLDLMNGNEALREQSFAQVLFSVEDSELFPPPMESDRPWPRIMREGAGRMMERR